MATTEKLHFEVLIDGSWRNMTDDELRRYEYAARYANYGIGPVLHNGEWVTYEEIFARHGVTLEEIYRRNREMLARLDAIQPVDREAQFQASLKPSVAAARRRRLAKRAAAAADIIAPAGTTSTRRSYGTGKCAVCRKDGSHWNPGAGSFLCARHWDEY